MKLDGRRRAMKGVLSYAQFPGQDSTRILGVFSRRGVKGRRRIVARSVEQQERGRDARKPVR